MNEMLSYIYTVVFFIMGYLFGSITNSRLDVIIVWVLSYSLFYWGLQYFGLRREMHKRIIK